MRTALTLGSGGRMPSKIKPIAGPIVEIANVTLRAPDIVWLEQNWNSFANTKRDRILPKGRVEEYLQ